MEYQNITKLLDTTFPKVPRFITKKRIAVHDLSAGSYNINKQTRFKIPMLRSDLCDFSDAYIVVKRKFTANFNPRKVYANNDFPDELLLIIFFLMEALLNKQILLELLLKQLSLMMQIIMIQEILSKVFLLETMHHFLIAF